jgi:hypothetical protein
MKKIVGKNNLNEKFKRKRRWERLIRRSAMHRIINTK